MAGSLNHPGRAPRVFISYARAGGETYTTNLYTRLEKAGIPCWMDRFGMEGGKDWRQQILETYYLRSPCIYWLRFSRGLEPRTIKYETQKSKKGGCMNFDPGQLTQLLDHVPYPIG